MVRKIQKFQKHTYRYSFFFAFGKIFLRKISKTHLFLLFLLLSARFLRKLSKTPLSGISLTISPISYRHPLNPKSPFFQGGICSETCCFSEENIGKMTIKLGIILDGPSTTRWMKFVRHGLVHVCNPPLFTWYSEKLFLVRTVLKS